MKIINLYVSDSKDSGEIKSNEVEYGKNVEEMSPDSGVIKNRFVREINKLDNIKNIYLKNFKSENNSQDILFKISRNEKITENNYKEYIRKNGIVTSESGLILRTLDNCTDMENMCNNWHGKLKNKYGSAIVDITTCGYIYKKNILY